MERHPTDHGSRDTDARMLALGVLATLCVFPYFSPVRLGIDTSPLYLLPAIALCVLGIGARSIVLERGLWLAAVAWLTAGLVTAAKALSTHDLGALRFAIGLIAQGLLIAALGSAPLADAAHSRRTGQMLSTVIYWGALAWLIAALVQLTAKIVGSPAAAEATLLLVSASRTSEGRGVTALAAEPSFAGITCTLLAAFAWVLKSNGLIDPRRGRIAIASFAVVAMLTVSFVSYLSLAILGLFIARRSTLTVAASLALLASIFFLPIEAIQNLRIVELVRTLASSPELILADASVGMRAADIVGRLFSMATPGGMFGHFFESDSMSILQQSLGLVGGETGWYLRNAADTMLRGSQPMSSLGALVFEFGVFGLALYAVTAILIWRCLRASGLRGTGVLFAIATFGFMTQLPLSYPTAFALPLLLGLVAKARCDGASAASPTSRDVVLP